MHAFSPLRGITLNPSTRALRTMIISAGIAATAIFSIVSGGGAGATSLAAIDTDTREPQSIVMPGIFTSAQDVFFWEMNVNFPVETPRVTSTSPDFLLLELNSYGEHFIFDTDGAGDMQLPYPDDVPQTRDNVIMY
jgi:hypothetical protein